MRASVSTITGVLVAAAITAGSVAIAAPAHATDPIPHLTAAQELIDQLNLIGWEPASGPSESTYNYYATAHGSSVVTWGTPGTPTSYLSASQCAPLVTAALEKGLGVDADWIQARFGSTSPYSSVYYDKFAADLPTNPPGPDVLPNFETRQTLSAVQPGDILAIKYTDQAASTGHTAIVVQVAMLNKDADATLEYAIQLADSTSNPHGVSLSSGQWADSRTTATTEYGGAGYGWIVVDPDAADKPAGYWWGVNEGLYRSSSIRPMLFSKVTPPA